MLLYAIAIIGAGILGLVIEVLKIAHGIDE